ncbi:MAG: MoxR family ATPase [Thermotogae bacterium]|nr:MoxR family ATPase [Thermotogota bacterium]HPB86050.1 MoxR family ATPase [Thermotogota bacterium]
MENNALELEIASLQSSIQSVFSELHRVIVGQEEMLEGILIALMTKGNLLIEGLPGLAKSLAVSTYAKISELSFHRIQFTPDLLPGDITGTLIFNMRNESFVVEKGPIFANFILADEINRAPAKVQSALLEAMQEKQVSIGKTTYPLPKPFLVMATQNPIEQEGTYPLPEAQMDRFLLKLEIKYPTFNEEKAILDQKGVDKEIPLKPCLSLPLIDRLQRVTDEVYVDEKLINYIAKIVYATRDPARYKLDALVPFIRYGASPRGSLSLLKACKAYAVIQGRSYVNADDIKKIAYPVLRHRILLTFEAEADGLQTEEIINRVLQGLPVP